MVNEQVMQDVQPSKNEAQGADSDIPTELNFEQFDDELLILACFLIYAAS